VSDLKAKMHQNPFRLGLCPRPRWGTYSAPQTLQLDLRGLLLRGGRERERKKEGRERRRDGMGSEGKGREGKGGGNVPV